MKKMFMAILLPIIIIFELGTSICRAEELSACQFAGPDGKLDEKEAALYLAYYHKVSLSELMAPDEKTLDPNKVLEVMENKGRLSDLKNSKSINNEPPPWTCKKVDAAFTQKPEEKPLHVLKQIDGLTKEKILGNGSVIGPILLRKNTEELSNKLSNPKGVTLAYSKNGLKSDSEVFSSEGVLAYPVNWNAWQGGRGRSLEMGLNFASGWKYTQVRNDPKKEVEELTFSAPLIFYVSPGTLITGAPDPDKRSSRFIMLQAKPYFVTDFGFQDEIYGVEATGEYIGYPPGLNWLYMGDFDLLTMSAPFLKYQLRLIPKLDYSTTVRSGIHTTREENDDWFRLGGTGSLDLRLSLKPFHAMEAGVSYQFLQAVSGSGGYSCMFQTHATLWVIENIGATIEYSKGDTPVANSPIDLITLNLEFKY